MRIMLASLVLNEMEFLLKLYEQHRYWPGVVKWVFVEGADPVYAAATDGMVTERGLSVDGTSDFLLGLTNKDQKIALYQPGFMLTSNVAQNKCALRNVYLEAADEIKPDWIVVVDADEFYTHQHQAKIGQLMKLAMKNVSCILLRQRHIWYPPGDPGYNIMEKEVVGGYWQVPHCRIWRWTPGIRYTNNHNTPHTVDGRSLATLGLDYRKYKENSCPQCIHMAFASDEQARVAKHAYYIARGEGPNDGRQMYVDCRRAWETWEPGTELPHGARVIPYDGPVPEVFK